MYVQCGGHYCSGAYVSNMKCRYASASGHITALSSYEAYILMCYFITAQELIGICGIYMAF